MSFPLRPSSFRGHRYGGFHDGAAAFSLSGNDPGDSIVAMDDLAERGRNDGAYSAPFGLSVAYESDGMRNLALSSSFN